MTSKIAPVQAEPNAAPASQQQIVNSEGDAGSKMIIKRSDSEIHQRVNGSSSYFETDAEPFTR